MRDRTTEQPNLVLETDLPARLDRLPWSAWHWRIVTALGITWILDGLEVTLVGAVGGVLKEPTTLGLTESEIGLSGTSYLLGAVLGALVFGRLADRFGRKKLFLVTLGVYLVATLLTGASWDFTSFAVFRFATGLGIGGECAAINSAIDELIPARVRGVTDLAINGTYWLGTALGAGLSSLLLDPRVLGHSIGWRVAFASGAIVGLAVLLVRRNVPESPRWLLLRGRVEQAEAIVAAAENVSKARSPDASLPRMRIVPNQHVGFGHIASVLFRKYPRRTFLGFSLMISQAFFYNALLFTYPLVLTRFYSVLPERVGLYLLPFALGNFLGPLLLGRLYDTVGRRMMIGSTYALSGALLLVIGALFLGGVLTAVSQTLLWSLTFFVASAAASSAYLTVSEVFPVEMRALAIAFFYAGGTAVGGALAPYFFGRLIETGERIQVFLGYVIGGTLMMAAGIIAFVFGVDAERKPLEEVAEPLSLDVVSEERGRGRANTL